MPKRQACDILGHSGDVALDLELEALNARAELILRTDARLCPPCPHSCSVSSPPPAPRVMLPPAPPEFWIPHTSVACHRGALTGPLSIPEERPARGGGWGGQDARAGGRGRGAALTQRGQHVAELGAHDRAVALLVEDPQPLHEVLVGARVLVLGDVLQHGQERFEVHHLGVELCGEKAPIPRSEGQDGLALPLAS